VRHLVVHAHLYQPPRENPWTEVVERQPSAAPFHDWNARVSDECYERLGAAGVRGPDGRVVALVNLFARLSFNVGPTLAAWLARERPDALADAVAGDRAARDRTGHGSALMQAYGHPILPLCEPRERRLQLAWGKADFLRRFGRQPEGAWLPECAVDLPTLEACVDAGLKFTVVAPEQVRGIRPPDSDAFIDTPGASVPPHRPYWVRLPSGRRFTVFVFDGPLSRGVAFGGTLRSGETLLSAFRAALDGAPNEQDSLVLMAADGETFGHHQKNAESSLAEALLRARMAGIARVTHLGELFHRWPATWEAHLATPSAWSCAHGVGRWERDCGCVAASHPGWSWGWRQVLRHAVTLLRDRVFTLAERRGAELFRDVWAAAEAYGEVLAAPAPGEPMAALLEKHAAKGLDDAGRLKAAALLELLRQTLFSATSCGWFFDDIAGIEATQVLRHAERACQLCQFVFGVDPEPDLAAILASTRANEPGAGTGADVLRLRARPSRRTGGDVAAAHAASRLAELLDDPTPSAPAATACGAYVAEDVAAPSVARGSGGRIEIEGEVAVRHLRAGAAERRRFKLVCGAPGCKIALEIDGKPAGQPAPEAREALLFLAARRAASLLPAPNEETLIRLAWFGREARALGATLPSPFPEALRGGARALLQDLLQRQPRDPKDGLRLLAGALAAARSTGLAPADLGDLRPDLERLLAHYAGWTLAAAPEALPSLAAAIEAARLAAGEAVLSRTRRFLVERQNLFPADELPALLGAAGLARDALAPQEAPPAPYLDDDSDALV